MVKGLGTVIYHVTDLNRAKAWYSTAFQQQPYFDEPFYVGFNVGGYELGLQPDEADRSRQAEGVVAYWGVGSAEAALQRLFELGAAKHEDIQDVGGEIKVATVKDPFGNVFGIIENPHFKLL